MLNISFLQIIILLLISFLLFGDYNKILLKIRSFFNNKF